MDDSTVKKRILFLVFWCSVIQHINCNRDGFNVYKGKILILGIANQCGWIKYHNKHLGQIYILVNI